MITNEKSKQIKCMRFFATLSIIMAHVTLPETSKLLNFVYSQLSCIGVPMFLCISGYLFQKKVGETYISFLVRKFKTLIVPWLFCSSVVYFWLQFRGHSGFDCSAYVKFILGYGSIYYFVPVLMIIMSVFFVNYSTHMCVAMIVMNLVSSFATASGLMKNIGLESINYINCANWIGFFALGMLIRRGYLKKLLSQISVLIAALAALSASLMLGYAISIDTGYFSWLSLITECAGIVIVYHCSKMRMFRNRAVFCVASSSFCIYLIHQPILGFFLKRCQEHSVLLCFLPIVIAFGISGLLYLFNWTLYRLRLLKLQRVVCTFLGVRL